LVHFFKRLNFPQYWRTTVLIKQYLRASDMRLSEILEEILDILSLLVFNSVFEIKILILEADLCWSERWDQIGLKTFPFIYSLKKREIELFLGNFTILVQFVIRFLTVLRLLKSRYFIQISHISMIS
jgi:hypothetical protein